MSAEPVPETPTPWFYPPPGGWTADDLDKLPPEAPRRIELLDGALIVMSPQTNFHVVVIDNLSTALRAAKPDGIRIPREMTVTLGKRQRLEPDLMVARYDPEHFDLSGTTVDPDDVLLAIEVVSDESEIRDRQVKPQRYAAAGIPQFWLVEQELRRAIIHTFELDPTASTYRAARVVRERTTLHAPFPVEVDPMELVRP